MAPNPAELAKALQIAQMGVVAEAFYVRQIAGQLFARHCPDPLFSVATGEPAPSGELVSQVADACIANARTLLRRLQEAERRPA